VRSIVPLTEDSLIAAIKECVGTQPRRLVVGIGDDAAAWKAPRSHLSVVSTDMLVDGVHFRGELTTPEALGHKALAVNLSDIAAIGARPVLAVVALGLTATIDATWARGFYRGMATCARTCGCAIAGGDIVSAAQLMIAVTAVGDVRRSGLRLRSTARPGDIACVSGPLGLAAAGLRIMMDQPTRSGNGYAGLLSTEHAATLRAAYELPTPRVAEGRFLAASRATHAMMDISDGLSLDGARMALASGLDLCLDMSGYGAHPALAAFTQTPLELVLHGGDDYELLAAVEPRTFPHLRKRYRARFQRELVAVGRFEPGEGKVWMMEHGVRREHEPRGYDHLRQRHEGAEL
jgi:thiamine-monophosphate kinase